MITYHVKITGSQPLLQHADDIDWADAMNEWRLDKDGATLSLKQEFQNFSGTMTKDGAATPVTGGRLLADELSFTAGGTEYKGKVRGDLIEGTTKAGDTWQAKRGS